jgi:two-component system NarL family response regulator
VRVLLVDDHPLFLEGMVNLFASHGINVVGTAKDGLEALEQVQNLQPNVIFMDVYMPRCNGLLAIRLIKAELPKIKIIMLTASEEEEDLFEAIKSGACGYLLKNLQVEDLQAIFSDIENGEPPMAPGLAMKVLKEFAREQEDEKESLLADQEATEAKLSPRQTMILSLVAQGQNYRQVAETLFFSERTIKYEIKEILKRLHLNNRSEAIGLRRAQWYCGRKNE